MFEAYKVATTLTVTNQVSGVLSVIASQFAKTDRAALKLKGTLKELSAAQLGLAGAMVGGAGLLGLAAIKGAVKPAMEYAHQLELAKDAGMTHLEIAKATAAAWQTASKVMTSTPTENLKVIRELRGVFGDTKDAIDALPHMQKLQGILANTLHGQGGAGTRDVAFTAAKMLELRGVSMNPAAFDQQTDLIVKAVLATGGKVTPQMLLQAQKYGGIGATGYSNDFTYGILPTLVQELGGSSTGNSLTSMYRAVVGGRIDKKALPLWQRLGLLDSVKGVTGETAMIQARDAKLYQDNPFLYMQHLNAELARHGITDPKQQQQIYERLFSNRTAGRIGNILGTQGVRLEKDFNLIGQAGSTEAYDRMLRKDPVMAAKALGEQWETLKTAFGTAVIPVILPAMRGLTSAFNHLGVFLNAHPTINKALTLTFAGLSGLAVIGGGLLIAGAGLKMIGAPLGLLVKPIGALAALPLAGIATGIGLIAGALAAAGSIVYHKEIAGVIDKAAPGIGDSLLAAKNWLSGDWKPSNANRSYVPPPSNKPVQVSTAVNLDGRQIANVVSQHQTAAMNRTTSTGSGVDWNSAFPSPGFSFAP